MFQQAVLETGVFRGRRVKRRFDARRGWILETLGMRLGTDREEAVGMDSPHSACRPGSAGSGTCSARHKCHRDREDLRDEVRMHLILRGLDRVDLPSRMFRTMCVRLKVETRLLPLNVGKVSISSRYMCHLETLGTVSLLCLFWRARRNRDEGKPDLDLSNTKGSSM